MGRFGSENPIVKFGNRITENAPIKIPEELILKRKELKMDYGRFDFVIYDNRAILLDVNKTMGTRSMAYSHWKPLDELALGIKNF